MLRNGYNKLLGSGFRPGPQTICDGIQHNVFGLIVARINQGDPAVRCLESVITNICGNKSIRSGTNRIVKELGTAATANRDTFH